MNTKKIRTYIRMYHTHTRNEGMEERGKNGGKRGGRVQEVECVGRGESDFNGN